MKKLFLTIGIFVFSASFSNCYSQENIDADYLIGWWMPNKDYCDMFFWKDINGTLKVQQIDNVNGKPYVLGDFEIKDESMFIRSTLFLNDSANIEDSTTFSNIFTIIDDLTMQCITTDFRNQEVTLITYSRIR
jgi:hypothetical protein